MVCSIVNVYAPLRKASKARLLSFPAASTLRPVGYAWQATFTNGERLQVRASLGLGEACPAKLNGAKRSMGHVLRLNHPKCKPAGPDLIGFTRDLKQRLLTHNKDRSPHTAKFSPWRIEFYCAFKQENKALAFERYLKSHSGKAFASKRLL